MKKYLIYTIILILFFTVGCSPINSFEDCIEAGNPAMESYPRQCRAGDITFVEEIEKPISSEQEITIEQAIELTKNTECTEKGTLTEKHIYNENSKTWWIDLEMKPEFKKEICHPACVINEETKTAEINWRCTGALPPKQEDEQEKTYCTEEQKNAEICTMDYTPVCGWFNENIRCIKYPCATTYSNSCSACSSEEVAYWTEGECPE